MPYNTNQELSDYAAARGITLTGNLSVLLQLAHDFIEVQSYRGQRADTEQTESFPRSGLIVDGVQIKNDVIPAQIKAAECEAAIVIDGGNDLLPVLESQVKREKVDVIEIEYQDAARSQNYYQKVMRLLNPFLASSGNSVSVTRA